MRITICLLLINAATLGFSSRKPEIQPVVAFDREVPVLLYSGQTASIESRGSAALECYRGVKLSEVYYFSSGIKLIYEDNGIRIEDDNGLLTIGLTEIRCKRRNETTVLFCNGKAYRGYFKAAYRGDLKGMTLLNIVDLEDYLAGVLPAEIGERTEDEFEAAKAQAVAARTYAVWRLAMAESQGVLFPTVADQVYQGKDSEMENLSRAIAETSGEIMTYADIPIAAYFHAVCGGKTQPVEDAWPDKIPLPYLEGAEDNDYCAWAKTYLWSEMFDDSTLNSGLRRYFVSLNMATADDFGKIMDIDFLRNQRTGRIELMEIFTESRIYKVEDDQIRWALGRPSAPGSILPSTMFEADLERTPDGSLSLLIDGRGNGHGVGMCQCGAIGRAREGQKYDKILKEYYKGVKIEKIY